MSTWPIQASQAAQEAQQEPLRWQGLPLVVVPAATTGGPPPAAKRAPAQTAACRTDATAPQRPRPGRRTTRGLLSSSLATAASGWRPQRLPPRPLSRPPKRRSPPAAGGRRKAIPAGRPSWGGAARLAARRALETGPLPPAPSWPCARRKAAPLQQQPLRAPARQPPEPCPRGHSRTMPLPRLGAHGVALLRLASLELAACLRAAPLERARRYLPRC